MLLDRGEQAGLTQAPRKSQVLVRWWVCTQAIQTAPVIQDEQLTRGILTKAHDLQGGIDQLFHRVGGCVAAQRPDLARDPVAIDIGPGQGGQGFAVINQPAGDGRRLRVRVGVNRRENGCRSGRPIWMDGLGSFDDAPAVVAAAFDPETISQSSQPTSATQRAPVCLSKLIRHGLRRP